MSHVFAYDSCSRIISSHRRSKRPRTDFYLRTFYFVLVLVLLLNAHQPTDDASRFEGENPNRSRTPSPALLFFPWVPGNHSIAHLRASSSAFTGWYHTGRFTCVLSL